MAALAGCFLSAGCDDPPPPPETVVTGTVTYRGKPVTGGIVQFYMDAGGKPRPYSGVIYEDGTYEVTYIVPGEAFIAVDTASNEGKATYMEIPRKYKTPSRTGLKYLVKEGAQTHDIVMD